MDLIYYLYSHWKIATPIAVAALNSTAIMAMIFERRELLRASRAIELAALEIDKLSSSLECRKKRFLFSYPAGD